MKIIVFLLGMLVVAGGAWPVLVESVLIPESWKIVPASGLAYQAIIVVIGVLTLVYALKKENVKVK